MDNRLAQLLGYMTGPGPSTSNTYTGSLPTPLTDGGPGYKADKRNAPVYSSAGLSQNTTVPWTTGGVARPWRAQFNPGTMDPMLATTLTAGHAGGYDRGAAAFLGAGYNPFSQEFRPEEGMVSSPNHSLDALFDTARGLGMDTSKYSREAGGLDIRGNRTGSGGLNAMDLYNDLNNHTRDYVSVGGLSNGWAGGPANNASRTIYKEVNGRLLPVTRPQFHMDTKDNGFIGREGITGLSMMLPAFGGWAGILGNGAANTLTAGGGLGLTSGLSSTIGSGLTNALINSGISAIGSKNPMSLLTGLGSSLVGAGLSSATGGSGLSNLFNTAGGSGPMNINPMTYYNSTLRNVGLGGSPLGQGLQGLRGIQSLANLWRG